MPDAASDTPAADELPQDGGGSRDIGQVSLDQRPFNPNGQAGGYSFEPITDPALDQHYASLAQKHDPDATPGLLGTFQRLPNDGVSDRWRYAPPNIPGAPLTDGDGNPCASWIVTRPIEKTGYLGDHNFVVVADSPGGPIQARFSYGPSMPGGGLLVSATGSHDDTDNGDLNAWANSTNPLSGVRMERIPASDAAVVRAGQSLDHYLGTASHPGSVQYLAVPEFKRGSANSNTAASAVANQAISHNAPPLNHVYLEPYPGSLSPGWYESMPGWKP